MLLALCACLFACASAWADIVYLKNGGRLEGKVIRKNGKVFIEQPNGTIVIDEEKVERIERKVSIIETYEERLAQIDEGAAGAAAQWAALGQWCRQNQMKRQAEAAFKKALARDPEQELARQALGFVRHEGRWLTPEESQKARGLVKHGETWVTPEAKQDLAKLEAQAETAKRSAELDRLKLELAKAEAAKAEAEAARAQAEAERAKAEAERAKALREIERLRAERAVYLLVPPPSVWPPPGTNPPPGTKK
jgi:tetratricopeptide (TPR) repeat protein